MTFITEKRRLIISICLLVTITACKKKPETEDAEALEEERVYQIAVVPGIHSSAYWKVVRAGIEKAAAEIGALDIVWESAEQPFNRQEQINIVRKQIPLAPDGLILAPVDNVALMKPVQEVMLAGIPVIAIDVPLDGENGVGFVGTDNFEAGKTAARELGRILNGKGDVLVVPFQKDNQITREREKGFLEVVQSEFPDLRVLDADQFAGPSIETAFHISENLLIRYPQAEAVYCSHDRTTLGMLKAVRDIDRAGKIKLIGSGLNEVLSSALGEGEISALVTPNSFKIGYVAIQTFMGYLSGDSTVKTIQVPAELITRENIHDPEKLVLLDPASKN